MGEILGLGEIINPSLVAADEHMLSALHILQVLLTAGTILDNMKMPLTVWFWAAYLMGAG